MEKKCKICNDIFEAKHGNSKYCSKECYQIHHIKETVKWQKNNEKRYREGGKKYYQNNKEKIAEYYKKRYPLKKEKIIERARKWKKKNPERAYLHDRKYQLKRTFGITLEEYENILKNQEYKCAICGKPQKNSNKKFAVDHCHVTGKIRGLLCTRCNRGLGYFCDEEGLLSKAINYLINK